MQYERDFPSLPYLATYFTSLKASEIIAKYMKQGKYLPILHAAMRDNYFIAICFLKPNMTRVF